MNIKSLYILVLSFSLFSCNNYSKKQDMIDIVKDWSGKEIKFPPSFDISTYLKSDNNDLPDYKIFVYIDSVGCSSCKLQLPEWKNFITQLDSITDKDIQFIFILHPKEIREIKIQAKLNKFNYPLYFDKNNDFDKLNKFPSDISLQTFLLDKNNKVILLGNPVQNPKMKELYINKILNKKNEIEKTDISVNKTEINLGSFNWIIPQETTLQIKNIGNNQLTILDIVSSCGCTVPEYDLESVAPGGIINFKITFTAERPEYFERNVIIHCNIKDSPIEIIIKGDAIKEDE